MERSRHVDLELASLARPPRRMPCLDVGERGVDAHMQPNGWQLFFRTVYFHAVVRRVRSLDLTVFCLSAEGLAHLTVSDRGDVTTAAFVLKSTGRGSGWNAQG